MCSVRADHRSMGVSRRWRAPPLPGAQFNAILASESERESMAVEDNLNNGESSLQRSAV